MADEYIINVKANTKSAESSIDGFSSSAASALKKIGLAAAAYLSVREAMQFLKEGTASAIEADKAVMSLNRALASAGNYSKEASDSFTKYASELQKTTGVSDDLIIQNASLLASLGKLSGDGLQQASKAALDLAAFMQIDVASAFDVVTKASQGNVGMLAKYGLTVDKAASDSQKFAAALKFIDDQMGGSATASLNTYEGAINRLSNSYKDLQEETGKLITKSPGIRALFITLADSIDRVSERITNSFDENAMTSVINFALAFSYVIATVVERTLSLVTAVATAFNYIVYGVFGPLEQLVGKFGGVLAGLIQKILPGNLIGDTLAQWSASIEAHGASLSAFAQGSLQSSGDEIKNVFKGITEETGVATAAIIEFQQRFADAAENAKKSSKELGNSTKKVNESVKDTANAIGSAVSSSVGKSIDVLATQLANGKLTIGSFGKAMLGIFGDLAQMIGAVFISTAIGMMALGQINPWVLAVAGAGLIAVGAVLKAFSGSGGVGNAGFTGANPTASIGVDEPQAAEDQFGMLNEEERAQAQTGIVVNVQGNIFDNRETGLAIANIINDAFDNNGVLIRAT